VFDLFAHAPGTDLDEMRDERGDVFAPRPQRRQQNRKDVQAVVQVDAEFSAPDHLCEIAVRGGDQAHIDVMGAPAAQALEFLFLQDAKQFGLQCRRNVADLIQKQRALVGQLEPANLLRDCAGERALLVAEQLAFEQIQRNGRAIHFDEGASASRADVVNGARDQFLAGTRFPLDQYSRICGRHAFDLFEHRFECRAVANDLLESSLTKGLIIVPESIESSHRGPPLPYVHAS